METTYICDICPIRKSAEAQPNTLKARMWRFHTRFCPMRNSYQQETGAEPPADRSVPSELWAVLGVLIVGAALLLRRKG